jgi:hypothetical protein
VSTQLPQPNRDRLSALTALVLLTYTLLRVVNLPTFEASITILDFRVSLQFNAHFVLMSLVSALTIAGVDWLIELHPQKKTGWVRIEHWIIPGMAALGAGSILSRLPQGPWLWLGLVIAAILLVSVLVAEFIMVDPADPRHDIVAIGLTTLGYLLIIGLLFAMRVAVLRAIISIPLTMLAGGALTWRLIRMRPDDEGAIRYAITVGGLLAQLAWGLHYVALDPWRAAMILGLSLYLGNGMTQTISPEENTRGRMAELLFIGLAGLSAIILLT